MKALTLCVLTFSSGLSAFAGCRLEPKPDTRLVKICADTLHRASLPAYDKRLDKVLRGSSVHLSHWHGGDVTPNLWSATVESSSGKFRTGIVLDEDLKCDISGLLKPNKYVGGVG